MSDLDQRIRAAAFACCALLERAHRGAVPWEAIDAGFAFEGERVHLANRARGIHWPRQMGRGVLSIKTTVPRAGRRARYDDALKDNGDFSYAFQGHDPRSRDNQALREAFEDQTPLIYLYGIVPGLYQLLYPCFVTAWDADGLRCAVAVENPLLEGAGARAPQRRYATVEAKTRIHQARFRELVLDAYGRRCAVSGMPIPGLLEAAHIIPDSDARGEPQITNGLCLSSLHHSAYDRQLLGIDPDGVVHIAPTVLATHDGPTLETALKSLQGARLRLPRQPEDRPDRDRLALRFEQFRSAL